jgi:acetoin utilization protein AcuB
MAYLVSDFMSRQLTSVAPDDSLRAAMDAMQSRACRHVPVVEHGRLVGILSDRDLRRALVSPFVLRERWYDEAVLDNTLIRACMSCDVVTVTPDTPLIHAAQLMRDRKIGGLPVLDNERLVGIITETDVLNALIQLLSAAP